MSKSSFKNKKNVSALNYSIYSPSQPKITKRIAAFIVDIILEIITATGIGFLVSVIYGYDSWYNKMIDVMKQTGVYVESSNGGYTYCDSSLDSCKSAKDACINNPVYQEASRKVFYGILVIITIGIITSLLIYEFILPLIFKHGRTIGMRFFDVGYVTDEGIEPSPRAIFVRFLFGKCIIEGLIPALSIVLLVLGSLGAQFGLLGVIFFAIELLLNIYMLVFTPNKRGIHDYISRLIPCDNSCQIYCKTIEELNEAKAKENSK